MKTGKLKIGSKKRKWAAIIKSQTGAWALLLPAVFCLYFFVLRPQILGIGWSFFDMKGYKLGDFVGLDNYKRVIGDTMFLKTVTNTFLYVFWSIIVGFLIPIIIAILLNEMVHLRNTFRVMVYFPSILPGAAVALLWYMMFYPDQGGLLNMVLGEFGLEPYVWLQDGRYTILYIVISMTWSGAGGTAIYYFASLQGVNRELYEAAIIDGAGFIKRLWNITLPHMGSVILLFLVRQIISVFSIMEQPLQMTGGGPDNASMTLGLLAYQYGFVSIKANYAMVVGVIMFAILLVFTCFYFVLNKKMEDNNL